MIELQEPLCEAAVQMAAKGLSFRIKAPPFAPLKGERPQRPREYWPEKNFKWPAAEDPRPAWRHLPRPDYQLKDNLRQYPCTPTAVASIAHCHLSCSYCGWRGRKTSGWTSLSGKSFGMTTRITPISTTSILIDRMLQVCCRLRLLCLDLRTIRSPPSLLVSLRGFPIKTIPN